MNKEHINPYFDTAHVIEKESELLREGYSVYLESVFLQRLKGVSFLGVLDFVYKLDNPSNRYVHTVCVANLALQLSRRLKLSPDMERAFVIANMLHDVGHAAFSHNSEPFLVEHLNLYHQGLLSAFFMHSNRFADNGTSLARLLGSENSFVAQTVTNLILQSRHAIQPLEMLFHSPLNCDKIEGNHRTLLHLGRNSIDPQRMLELFTVVEGRISLNVADINLVVEFWAKERDVYWEDIYTSAVFSAEAMLTRAMEIFFDGPEQAETFLFLTNDQALESIGSCEQARDLVQGVRTNKLFLSMRDTRPDVLEMFSLRLKEHRFDKAIRAEIEAEIAEILETSPDRVISHFSRRKHFDSRFGELQQMALFDADPDRIFLEIVVKAFLNSKKSGDFFDVFFLPSNVEGSSEANSSERSEASRQKQSG